MRLCTSVARFSSRSISAAASLPVYFLMTTCMVFSFLVLLLVQKETLTFCGGLTRSRRENPAFNYGFFRPNPLVFGWVVWENEEHAPELIRSSAAEQTKIARPGSRRYPAQAFQHPL